MISEKIKSLIQKNLDEKKFTACALGIQKISAAPDFYVVGNIAEDKNGTKVDSNSLFDLASLTKVIFTTTFLAKLSEEKKIELDVPFSKIKTFGKKITQHIRNDQYLDATFEDLLLHRAGFAAVANYEDIFSSVKKDVRNYAEDVPARMIEGVSGVKPEYKLRAKSIYSDLGFIFLTEILSLHFEESLENIWLNQIQKPLQLSNIKNIHQLQKNDVIVTSAPNLPAGTLHDPAERNLNKLCGHAGLFGSIQDVMKFGLVWLQAYQSGHPFLKKETAHRFVDPYLAQDRRLGWDGVSENSTAGCIAKNSIGHLGYTGTSLWIDLQNGIVVTLLTNRTRSQIKNVDDLLSDGQKKDFNNFRRDIHNAIWETSLS